MYSINLTYIKALPQNLGFKSNNAFLTDWGHNRSAWFRIFTKSDMPVSVLLEWCNRYGLHPLSFFLSDLTPDGPDYSPAAHTSTPHSVWSISESLSASVIRKLGFSYNRVSRFLSPDSTLMVSTICDICNRSSLSPSDFFQCQLRTSHLAKPSPRSASLCQPLTAAFPSCPHPVPSVPHLPTADAHDLPRLSSVSGAALPIDITTIDSLIAQLQSLRALISPSDAV